MGVNLFWLKVQTLLHTLLQITFQLDPAMSLLGLLPPKMPKDSKRLTLDVLMAVRCLIAFGWQQAQGPSTLEFHSCNLENKWMAQEHCSIYIGLVLQFALFGKKFKPF